MAKAKTPAPRRAGTGMVGAVQQIVDAVEAVRRLPDSERQACAILMADLASKIK